MNNFLESEDIAMRGCIGDGLTQVDHEARLAALKDLLQSGQAAALVRSFDNVVNALYEKALQRWAATPPESENALRVLMSTTNPCTPGGFYAVLALVQDMRDEDIAAVASMLYRGSKAYPRDVGVYLLAASIALANWRGVLDATESNQIAWDCDFASTPAGTDGQFAPGKGIDAAAVAAGLLNSPAGDTYARVLVTVAEEMLQERVSAYALTAAYLMRVAASLKAQRHTAERLPAQIAQALASDIREKALPVLASDAEGKEAFSRLIEAWPEPPFHVLSASLSP